MNSEILRIIGLGLLLVLPIYVYYVYRKFGVQKSISMSYYCFKPKDRWKFQLTIWVTACGGALTFQTTLGYVASGLLLMVALFPTIKEEWHKVVHMFGAISSIILYFMSTYIDFHQKIAIISMLIVSGGLCIYDSLYNDEKDSDLIWNIEISAFIILILTILRVMIYDV